MTIREASQLADDPLQGISLIEASAGTGKTYTICSLYLRLVIEQDYDVQQILVVTFTKAATAELRERIRARLVSTYIQAKASEPLDKPKLQRLERALQCMDEAAIFTIHGFCQRALADRPFEAGQAFDLELVGSDDELIEQLTQDYWRHFTASDQCTPELASYLHRLSDSPKRFANLLKKFLSKPLAKLQWPEDIDDLDCPNKEVYRQLFAEASQLWLNQRDAIILKLRNALVNLNRNSYNEKSLATAFNAWDEYLAASYPRTLAEFDQKIALLSSKNLTSRKLKGSDPPKHRFFDLVNALIEHDVHEQKALELARFRLLRHMLEWSTQTLRKRRMLKRQVSFDEMLLNLYQALCSEHGERLAASLREKYPAALIDEFQDTDPLQFSIFSTIYKKPQHPLFFVGDPKQAIYSFRSADLNTYLRARHQAAKTYSLDENQRSSRSLIEAVNAIFSINKQAFVVRGLDFLPVKMGTKPRALFIDHNASDHGLNIWMLPGSFPCIDPNDSALSAQPIRADEDGATENTAGQALIPKSAAQLQSAQACAAEVARLIRDAQDGLVSIAGKALTPGDIAVLVRTHKQGSLIKHALADLEIASVELSQASVFQSHDAKELERICLAIHQPANRGLLRAALATEMMGLDAKQIEVSLEDDMQLLPFIDRFYLYRDLWQQRGFGVMFRRFLELESIASRLLVRQDGERRMTNLLHLGELLHEASQVENSMAGLLGWLARQLADDRQHDHVQIRLESDRNLVQIITIHKSKGLEFPVVFCPFLWDSTVGKSQRRDEVLVFNDATDGPTIHFVSKQQADEKLESIKEQIALDEAAETIRLIYVALTRAVHRCYLIAGCYLSSEKRASPAESTSSMLNWLIAGHDLSPQDWLFDKNRKQDPNTVSSICNAWRALAQSAKDCIKVSRLPSIGSSLPLALGHDITELIEPPQPPKPQPSWRLTSFSAMTRQHESRVKDLDEASAFNAISLIEANRVEDTPGSIVDRNRGSDSVLTAEHPSHDQADHSVYEPKLDDDDMLHFPKGPNAGICLHQIFETIEFDCPASWPERVDEALANAQLLDLSSPRTRELRPTTQLEHGISPEASNAKWHRMAMGMLDHVLHTELGQGLVLSKIDKYRRLTELEFTIHTASFDHSRLDQLLSQEAEDYGLEMPAETVALQRQDLQAYLKGFIDLVIEHDGRYFLIDWKSNHLGNRMADYGPEPLKRSMLEHRYHLQYLIYTLALDRYLRLRVKNYCYENHFGGVFYLFIRGVRPYWRNADRSPAGVFYKKPKAESIARLDRLFGEPPKRGPMDEKR
ncbi:MAG: exodeoxyribonuclease V subunit beta [Burkholderiaceae bacterium]